MPIERKSKQRSKVVHMHLLLCVVLSYMMLGVSFVKRDRIQEEPLNIIFIYPDQFRLHSIGIWNELGYKNVLRTKGDPTHTPHLNDLAKRSVLFTQATNTHPLCSPSRAMLLSGMYSTINGVYGLNCKVNRPVGLRDDISTLTDVLFEAGYETAYIGKAHWERNEAHFTRDLNYVGSNSYPGGYHANSMDTYIPPGKGRHGNSYWFQNIGDRHHDPNSYSSIPDLIGGKLDGEVYRPKKFTPKLETDIIVKYLQNRSNQRDSSKPFSLFWSPNPPHTPYEKISDTEQVVYRTYYEGKPIDQLLVRDNAQVSIDSNRDDLPDNPVISAPFYFSNVTSLDIQIGRIIATLKEVGEFENTIIFFTTDHGEMMGSQGLMHKNTIYDESFLAPFVIYHPKVQHRIDDLLIGTVDIMPTALSMLDLPIPKTVQGVDYSKGIMTGVYDDLEKPVSSFYTNIREKGIRTNKYTYCVAASGDLLIYDNDRDPYQMTPLDHDQITSEDFNLLKTELGNWLNKVGDSWAKNRKFEEKIIYPKSSKMVPISGLGIVGAHRYTRSVSSKIELKYRISPSNASNKTVHWTSDNQEIAIVDENGVVTCLSEGVANIKVNNEEGFEAICRVNVAPMEKIVGSQDLCAAILIKYKNPFSTSARIEYLLQKKSIVRIRIFDIHGRQVEILVDGFQKEGRHSIEINSLGYKPGVYVLRIETAEGKCSKKLIIN